MTANARTNATVFAVSCGSLLVSATMAAPTVRLLSTADGRHRALVEAPADTVTVVVLQLGLVSASVAATVVLGAVLVADLVTRRPHGRVARWTPSPVRRTAATVARLGLVTSAVVGALTPQVRTTTTVPVANASPLDPERLPDEPAVAVMATLAPGATAPPAHATARWLDPMQPTPPVTPAATHTPAAPAAPPAPLPDETWIVSAGDSFWSIAEDVLADRQGGPPAESQVAGYWQRLVDANRDRLPVPANPDILHAGQTLVLPPTA